MEYSIDDIIEQIEKEYGFISKIEQTNDTSKITIAIDSIAKINLILTLEETSVGYYVEDYVLQFPYAEVDIKDTTILLEAYQSAIEIVYLINETLERMGVDL